MLFNAWTLANLTNISKDIIAKAVQAKVLEAHHNYYMIKVITLAECSHSILSQNG